METLHYPRPFEESKQKSRVSTGLKRDIEQFRLRKVLISPFVNSRGRMKTDACVIVGGTPWIPVCCTWKTNLMAFSLYFYLSTLSVVFFPKKFKMESGWSLWRCELNVKWSQVYNLFIPWESWFRGDKVDLIANATECQSNI